MQNANSKRSIIGLWSTSWSNYTQSAAHVFEMIKDLTRQRVSSDAPPTKKIIVQLISAGHKARPFSALITTASVPAALTQRTIDVLFFPWQSDWNPRARAHTTQVSINQHPPGKNPSAFIMRAPLNHPLVVIGKYACLKPPSSCAKNKSIVSMDWAVRSTDFIF